MHFFKQQAPDVDILEQLGIGHLQIAIPFKNEFDIFDPNPRKNQRKISINSISDRFMEIFDVYGKTL